MAVKLIFLFWVFFTLLYRIKPNLDNVGPLLTQVIDGFNAKRKNMSLDNDAVIDNNGILQLSNNHSVKVDSHAFYKHPIQFKNSSSGKFMSFSTTFAFALINEHGNQGRHHFAFTIFPSGDLPTLILVDSTLEMTGRSQTTYSWWHSQSRTPNSVTSMITKLSSASTAALYRTNLFESVNQSLRRKDSFTLKTGHVIRAWVEYDARINQLNFTLA